MPSQYFHELTNEEFQSAILTHQKYHDFKKLDWCSMPDPLDWVTGCWSLTERKIKCEQDCINCDCYKKS